MTTAIVLSGGGLRGPLEVGALQSFFEHGIRPDFLAGTSAGAINSSYVAANGPDSSSIAGLIAGWHKGQGDIVYPGNVLTMAWRVLTGANSLFSGDGMRRLITENLPPGVVTFGQLKVPCYLTSVDLRSGRLYLFGDEPSASIVDGVVASSSMPGVHPPLEYHGLQLVDGGVVASTPISVAMDKGATVIYAVDLGPGEEVKPPARGVIEVLSRTLEAMLEQSLFLDLERASEDPKIAVHYINITAFNGIPYNDFSHIDEMIAAGKAATDAYLANPHPRIARPGRPPASPYGKSVAGAREYIPFFRR